METIFNGGDTKIMVGSGGPEKTPPSPQYIISGIAQECSRHEMIRSIFLPLGCDKEQHRCLLLCESHPDAHPVRGRRRNGQAGVPGDLEGHPHTE